MRGLLLFALLSMSLGCAESSEITLQLQPHAVANARPFEAPGRGYGVVISLNDICTKAFETFTAERVGQMLVITFEGKVLVRAQLMGVINTGAIQIESIASLSEAEDMAASFQANSEALPPPFLGNRMAWCFSPSWQPNDFEGR